MNYLALNLNMHYFFEGFFNSPSFGSTSYQKDISKDLDLLDHVFI